MQEFSCIPNGPADSSKASSVLRGKNPRREGDLSEDRGELSRPVFGITLHGNARLATTPRVPDRLGAWCETPREGLLDQYPGSRVMLDISKPNLILLVSAVNDAIKYNEAFLHSQTIKDVSDYEEHLLGLENLQQWLEAEYRKIQAGNPELLKYEQIVPSPTSE